MSRGFRFTSTTLFSILAPVLAVAQNGVLDQHSPRDLNAHSAQFNVDASFLVWQQQIRAGISGQLEGIKLTFAVSPVGANFHVRIRTGPTWSTNAVLFDGSVTNSTGGFDEVFVDMTSADIMLSAGDDFVMETQGTDSGAWFIGSYVDPTAGPPLYPYPLYLGPGGFPPGWRHGFDTYMLTGAACNPCDTNCDGSLNQFDIQPFVQSLLSHGGGCSPCAGDSNGDGSWNQFDIQGFVECLTH